MVKGNLCYIPYLNSTNHVPARGRLERPESGTGSGIGAGTETGIRRRKADDIQYFCFS